MAIQPRTVHTLLPKYFELHENEEGRQRRKKAENFYCHWTLTNVNSLSIENKLIPLEAIHGLLIQLQCLHWRDTPNCMQKCCHRKMKKRKLNMNL